MAKAVTHDVTKALASGLGFMLPSFLIQKSGAQYRSTPSFRLLAALPSALSAGLDIQPFQSLWLAEGSSHHEDRHEIAVETLVVASKRLCRGCSERSSLPSQQARHPDRDECSLTKPATPNGQQRVRTALSKRLKEDCVIVT
ncbi:MAG TPA: hypothetical protein VJN18_28600 [Polyangiaceae bacterium]|nr:hypothetical protein [Polyangiaceae bacterium]